jgi:DNA-directed RNA polymerase II subunit RPB4
MSAHAPTSRSREAPQGDEEAAAELKLGEFQDVDALTHSEAALVINALVQKRSADRKNVNETEYAHLLLRLLAGSLDAAFRGRDGLAGLMRNRMLSKTRDYLDHFARFKRKENVEAVERLLSAHKELAKFERAQLGTCEFASPVLISSLG